MNFNQPEKNKETIVKDKLILVGAGGHCKSVIDSIDADKYTEIVIVGKSDEVGHVVGGYSVVGTDDDLKKLYEAGFNCAFISLGSIKETSIRRKLKIMLTDIGYSFPNIIDKSASISKTANLGMGIFIGKFCIINAEAQIDDFAIINTKVLIEHDSTIGQFTHVSVGAVVCGSCTIESDVFIGASSTIKNNIHIGKGSVVGMASSVLTDLEENSFVMGNPAKEKVK